MDLYLFDRQEKLKKIIPPERLLEHQQTAVLGGLTTAYIQALYDKDIEKATYIGHKDVDNENIFHMYFIDIPKVSGNVIELDCTHSFFDDLKASEPIRDKRPQKVSAATGFNIVLEGTRWELGTVNTSKVASTNFYYISPLEAFWKAVEAWDVEFSFRMVLDGNKIVKRYLDIHDRLSRDYGKRYEYGDKLVSVVKEQSRESVYTAFLGRGKGEEKLDPTTGDSTGTYGRKIDFSDVSWSKSKGDPLDKPRGEDYLEFKEATRLYGYPNGKPRIQVIDFPNIEDKEELLQATYEYGLNACRPQLQLRSLVIDNNIVELGETVTVIRDDQDIRYKTRVFKLTRDFLEPGRKSFEFGDRLVVSNAMRTHQIMQDIKEQEENTVSAVDALLGAITNSFFNEDGYNYNLHVGNKYGLPGGFYSFNRPIDKSPTKAIYMGAGKLLISNKRNPDGSWNWRTAGTGDGLVADTITTGTLDANLIKTGVLSDKKGKSHIDMETGSINLANKITYNPGSNRFSIDGTLLVNEINGTSKRIDGSNLVLNGNTLVNGSFRVGGGNVVLDGNTRVNGDFNVSGSNITLDGNTTVYGSFKVPASSVFGHITADSIVANSITTQNVRGQTFDGIGINNSDFKSGGWGGTSFNGSGLNMGVNSSYIRITDRGGRGQVDINGTVGARGSGYSVEMNAGGLYIGGTRAVAYDGSSVVIGTGQRVEIRGPLYVQGKKIE